jgi:hypothetical protein
MRLQTRIRCAAKLVRAPGRSRRAARGAFHDVEEATPDFSRLSRARSDGGGAGGGRRHARWHVRKRRHGGVLGRPSLASDHEPRRSGERSHLRRHTNSGAARPRIAPWWPRPVVRERRSRVALRDPIVGGARGRRTNSRRRGLGDRALQRRRVARCDVRAGGPGADERRGESRSPGGERPDLDWGPTARSCSRDIRRFLKSSAFPRALSRRARSCRPARSNAGVAMTRGRSCDGSASGPGSCAVRGGLLAAP